MRETELYGLVYRSRQARVLSEAELVQLIERARARNQELGMTSLLLQCEGQFIQFLEGNKDDLFDLYQVIGRDDRHSQITLLAQGPLETRAAPNWALAFRRTAADEIARLPGLSQFLEGWDDLPELARPEDWSSRLLELFKPASAPPRR